MKSKTPCQCCRTPVFDISRRFDSVLGFICSTCFDFNHYAKTRLRKAGIEGDIACPVRHAPKSKLP